MGSRRTARGGLFRIVLDLVLLSRFLPAKLRELRVAAFVVARNEASRQTRRRPSNQSDCARPFQPASRRPMLPSRGARRTLWIAESCSEPPQRGGDVGHPQSRARGRSFDAASRAFRAGRPERPLRARLSRSTPRSCWPRTFRAASTTTNSRCSDAAMRTRSRASNSSTRSPPGRTAQLRSLTSNGPATAKSDWWSTGR